MSTRKRPTRRELPPPSPPPPPPPPPQIIGQIDKLVGRTLKGWAACPARADHHLHVAATLDGAEVARKPADLHRHDLQASGIGDGTHGFELTLPASAFDGAVHDIAVIADPDGVAHTLEGSGPLTLSNLGGLSGNVEGLTGAAIVGWVRDLEQPGTPIPVALQIDDATVATALADDFRTDLHEAGFGDGRHAFRLHIPPVLMDGQPHKVAVIVEGTHAVLPRSFGTIVLEMRTDDRHYSPDEAHQLFDPAFYAAQTGVITNGLAHYTATGWLERHDPHPLFSTEYYLAAHGRHMQVDPLRHFLTVGRLNDHRTHPLFDVAYYRRTRRDVQLHPLLHYLGWGWHEGAPVSPYFDEKHYEAQCPGIRKTFAPIVHYLQFGWKEGVRPHPEFDPTLIHTLARMGPLEEPYSQLLWTLEHTGRHARPQPAPAQPAPAQPAPAQPAPAQPAPAQPAPAQPAPAISYLILNLNKPLLTAQCLFLLQRFTDLAQAEIVVVDNGSHADKFAMLCDLARPARIVRLASNRGFGEGNNIGAEHARGTLLAFLNNDCFVQPDWLPPLLAALDDPAVGAVGPKFLYPDGRLQEAGAMIAPCGTALQRGKGLDGNSPLFAKTIPVDYCSAAALIVRAGLFRQVLGYDLCWDPAYYEDVDLCLKLRLLGKSTLYVANSTVIHLENTTSSDRSLDLRLHHMVAVNRLKFVARWGAYLQNEPTGHEHDLLAPSPGPPQPPGLPRLGLYTPYPLTPGGGERYLLTWAAALRGHYHCTLVSPDPFSAVRLATMARALDLQLDHVHLAGTAELQTAPPFDVFLAMGNQILPPIRAMGARNLFLCQFPFPLEPGHYAQSWAALAGYDALIVYSDFAARHVQAAAEALALPLPPVHVIHPPVPQVPPLTPAPPTPGRHVILNVGRFNPHGHCKRQDVMIASFLELVRAGHDIELHLAGSIGAESDSRDYIASLQKAASGHPVFFHVNISAHQIQDLYRRADIYWHLTGINDDARFRPEAFEHFGITIVEAMSAGVVPVVLGYGGPPEIVTNEIDGALIYNAPELRARTADLLANPPRLARLAARARQRAADFTPEIFQSRVLQLMIEHEPPGTP